MRLNLSDEPITYELLAEALRTAGSARIAVNGTSMHPTLQMGWWAYVEPLGGVELKPGEIAVFRGERYLTVHRLVRIERRAGEDTLVFRGDYTRSRERVPKSAVLGRVVAVEIPGRSRGEERIIALETDVLGLFYRCGHALQTLLRPLLPEPPPPGTPPGLFGRLLGWAVAFAERVLSLFLPERP
jgi:hypothetical protein